MATARGTSLIEAMIAIAILLIGLLGLATLQTAVVRANHFGKRLAQASSMAVDLESNLRQWNYTDLRLASSATVTALNAATIEGKWDLGRNEASSYTAQFSDKVGDTNASTPDALGSTYTGITGDVDGDGTPEFTRYWNVYAVNLGATAVENGKLVQLIVRWKEPFFGYRQISSSFFKINPASALQ